MNQVNRKDNLMAWVSAVIGVDKVKLQVMSGDAGFRQYYRVTTPDGQSFIVVDSPDDKCNNLGFIAIQKALAGQNILVPQIISVDESQGFFCLSDLGNTLLSNKLSKNTMESYYKQAIDIILRISKSKVDANYQLPLFDRKFVQMELSLFNDWLLEQYLGIRLSIEQKNKLQGCFDFIIDSVLEQPQRIMHRDYHSRNIMVMENNELGVIDFQDAVIGPVIYDLVSLLKDCYIKWPNDEIVPLVTYFVEQYQANNQDNAFPLSVWMKWFDLTGLQRHIKVAGIFARLFLRDDKSDYLADIPLTLEYIKEASANYLELRFLYELINDVVYPAMEKRVK